MPKSKSKTSPPPATTQVHCLYMTSHYNMSACMHLTWHCVLASAGTGPRGPGCSCHWQQRHHHPSSRANAHQVCQRARRPNLQEAPQPHQAPGASAPYACIIAHATKPLQARIAKCEEDKKAGKTLLLEQEVWFYVIYCVYLLGVLIQCNDFDFILRNCCRRSWSAKSLRPTFSFANTKSSASSMHPLKKRWVLDAFPRQLANANIWLMYLPWSY